MSCRCESYRGEFTPVLVPERDFHPGTKFIPVSCKRGMTVRFIFIKISSILRHYKARTPTNTALCKHSATFHLPPVMKVAPLSCKHPLSWLEHCSGITEVMGSNPVESPEFFRFMRQLLKLSSQCEDHIFI